MRASEAARLAVPQILTASRLVLGAAALVAASEGRLVDAATLVTAGALTDGLDGPVARRLGVATPFGALFDYFADYVCYIVAPWGLARAVAPGAPELPLALPVLTGAMRYARNGLVVSGAPSEIKALPGLGTVFVAFVPVTAVFLDASEWMGPGRLAAAVTALTVIFSVLMVAPIPYPKLSLRRELPPVVLVLLALMPFVVTRAIAAATVALGLLYVIAAPFAARARSGGVGRPAGFGDTGGDGGRV
jgi:CDP-diacylglycerol--serine O-phosphatidyltransferase